MSARSGRSHWLSGRELLAALQSGCPSGAISMEDPAVPDAVALAFFGTLDDAPTAYSKRLGQLVRNLPDDAGFESRMAVLHHGALDDPRVAADLLAAAETDSGRQVMTAIMRSLGGQSTSTALARWSAWCGTTKEAWACVPANERPHPARPDNASMEGPSPAARRLVTLGLASKGLSNADAASLSEHGAVGFDTETGRWPNEHDGLLATLWASADGLPPALFTETPPAEPASMRRSFTAEGKEVLSAPTHGPAKYRLAGFANGRKWEVDAEDLGDWYDMPTVLGLLNTMARDLGKPVRFVALSTGDQTSVVLAGRHDALDTAIREGILPIGRASDAEASGKAFEEKVLEELLRGER